MKRLLLPLLFLIAARSSGTTFSVSISGFSYTPAITLAQIGDTVNIEASTSHPAIQVSGADWTAGSANQLGSGWGKKTSNFTIVISSSDTIFFMCEFHGGGGMKARIIAGVTSHIPIAKIEHIKISNPAVNGKLRILFPDDETHYVRVFGTDGRFIVSGTLGNYTNDIIELHRTSGLYVVVIGDGIEQKSYTVAVD